MYSVYSIINKLSANRINRYDKMTHKNLRPPYIKEDDYVKTLYPL